MLLLPYFKISYTHFVYDNNILHEFIGYNRIIHDLYFSDQFEIDMQTF